MLTEPGFNSFENCLKKASNPPAADRRPRGRQYSWWIKNQFEMFEFRGKMPLPHNIVKID